MSGIQGSNAPYTSEPGAISVFTMIKIECGPCSIGNMDVELIAADSLGARSMATFIRTGDISVIIDPSVALGPWRYNKPPHPIEMYQRNILWEKIKTYAWMADIVVITHYHYDHHNPEFIDLFRGKTLLIKDPHENINKSQRDRSSYFLKNIEGIPSEVHYSDGRDFSFVDTDVHFSDAVPHGINPKLGYVTEVCIDDGSRFLYTSDIEGPSLPEQADFIIRLNPDILYCDGPMTYMLGFRYPQKSLNASISNLIRIIEETRVKHIILDHHLLRDIRWKERMKPLLDYASTSDVRIETAAGFMGEEDLVYEARRNVLYKTNPVSGPLVMKKDYWKG